MSIPADVFRELHETGCFIVPNPWDVVSARLLAHCGFKALASTSSGYAFTTGRRDSSRQISRQEAIEHAAELSEATGLPVTLDGEDCFADTPEGVAETVALAASAGLAGISIEDRDTSIPGRIRPFSEALERVQAAVGEARKTGIVLTARADGLGKGAYDLDEVLRRLSAFAEAGADVVYAPGLPDLEAVRTVCASVPVPVNHVIGQGATGLSRDQLADAGVRRISLGGSFTRAALGAINTLGQTIAAGDFTSLDRAPSWSRIR
ncbi:isocitrate lyase/phosphoenolpyruvate mutase family protein [Roseibium sp. FZY0029]|uniref:isocitrate lyase/PEP mutase family protein n=1 Tax=Roseibium sp. FZY0029 TaxID=3116647 RepID=UPI002EC613B8|nr:isocitrate lyase/phosphoenolpyruvate mutase family protein [Roseibium sp. FZY0029]